MPAKFLVGNGGQWTAITLTCGGKTIVVSADEVWAALGPRHVVNSNRLLPCDRR